MSEAKEGSPTDLVQAIKTRYGQRALDALIEVQEEQASFASRDAFSQRYQKMLVAMGVAISEDDTENLIKLLITRGGELGLHIVESD